MLLFGSCCHTVRHSNKPSKGMLPMNQVMRQKWESQKEVLGMHFKVNGTDGFLSIYCGLLACAKMPKWNEQRRNLNNSHQNEIFPEFVIELSIITKEKMFLLKQALLSGIVEECCACRRTDGWDITTSYASGLLSWQMCKAFKFFFSRNWIH